MGQPHLRTDRSKGDSGSSSKRVDPGVEPAELRLVAWRLDLSDLLHFLRVAADDDDDVVADGDDCVVGDAGVGHHCYTLLNSCPI